jgi:hypothetical protein
MLSVKNVSIVRVERKKFIFQNLPLDKSHFITGGENLANRAYLYAKKDKAFVAISEYNFSEAELDEKIEETRSFLEKQRGCRFFWLEGAEIYEYGGPALFGNLKMHRRISRIGTEIANFYRELDGVKPDERMGMIGIQEWADCLYYETD